MNKRFTLNLGAIICLMALGYILYYLLLLDNPLPFSIGAVLSSINHIIKHWHVLAVGLLPIYIALMIFGTGIISIYLGSVLQRWIGQYLSNK